MYKQNRMMETSMEINDSTQGEFIEQKIERILNNQEPISDGAPIIYTERGDGVIPAYDIRTDRWEVAIDAMDAVSKNHQAKRAEKAKMKAEEGGKSDEKGGEKGGEGEKGESGA